MPDKNDKAQNSAKPKQENTAKTQEKPTKDESNDKANITLDQLASLAKRRGFIFAASDIYGGLSGFWDYGPYGVEMVNRIKKAWWDSYVRLQPENYGIDGAIVQSPKLWKASGHVDGFIDPLVDCKNCNARHRADHLAGTDSTNLEELGKMLEGVKCPSCGQAELTEPRTYNMMMKTYVGPVEDDESVAYLRPETAGATYTNFELVRETTRSKIPFGIGQIGKAFRNEISPRDFIFRVRELEQAEMQYFIAPEDKPDQYERWRKFNWHFISQTIGLKESSLRWHEHGPDERAHYAEAAHDIQFKFPMGFKELMGTHNRTDFDLRSHQEVSGKDLQYFDQANDRKFVPNVIESAVGIGRLFMAVLTDAYTEEEVDGEARVVLKIKPELAPIDYAILPLMKKPQLVEKAKQVYAVLAEKGYNVEYDETQSIGKRYRRQDEIGTPKCVTIDFDTLGDGDDTNLAETVTIRDRDSMQQTRVQIADLA